MRAIVYHDIEIDVCPACRSIWLDRGEYDKIIEKGRKKRENSDGGGDVDISSSSGGRECEPDTGTDFTVDSVVDFLGDSVGSLFDGL